MTKHELETIADTQLFGSGINGRLMRYRYETLRPHFRGDRCLEFGCADGLMTAELIKTFDEVVAVDGAKKYCEKTRKKVSADNLTVENSLFQEFSADESFDTILACHILEHVEDPDQLLGHIRDLMAPGGRLLIDVPNANSLHRRAGVKMGLLETVDELNDRDREIGHERVYRRDQFHATLREAGYSIESTGGVFLKPLTNGQMEEWFSDEMLDAFATLGMDMPEHAAEIYAVCR